MLTELLTRTIPPKCEKIEEATKEVEFRQEKVLYGGKQVGTVYKKLRHGYHPSVLVSVKGKEQWYEIDDKDLVSKAKKWVKDALGKVVEGKFKLSIDGKDVNLTFKSKKDALDLVRSRFKDKPTADYEDGSGAVFRTVGGSKIASFKITKIEEATSKKGEDEWQAEKVLNYIEDLFNRAGKEELVVAREGTELLLKAQGKVFKVTVEKVM